MEKEMRRQVVLPWKQVVLIAYNSIRVRFFRSLITTLTLALAVAFAAFLWTGYDILNGIWEHAGEGLRERILESGYEMSGGRFGATAKDHWLAILSLIVCVVGIVNAQLMAVTERFREIGTFKCLGALNTSRGSWWPPSIWPCIWDLPCCSIGLRGPFSSPWRKLPDWPCCCPCWE